MRPAARLSGLAAAATLALSAWLTTATPALGTQTGPDWVASDNVKFIQQLPDAADGVGGKVIGNYLYMSSSKDLRIYDISDPPHPVLVSQLTLAVEWENEMLPTNGRLLGLSSSTAVPFVGPPGCEMASAADQASHPDQNCLAIYDVTDKANPRLLSTVFGAGDHTSTCILDCTYFWGSKGSVTDARDPAHARLICNWQDASNHLPGQAAHNVTEVTPGYILTSTQPVMLVSVLAKDGGSVCHPKLFATGANADGRFIHSNTWPLGGTDKFALIGGETNFRPQCGVLGQVPAADLGDDAAFMTWDTTQVYKDGHYVLGSKFHMIDQVRMRNGTYFDGSPPANTAGCSVHWFEQHPSFNGGGLVAVAAYDNGVRFMQVDATGHIKEVGFFRGAQSWASAPHWAPDGKTVYVIDYTRGIDVLQWNGPTYVPGVATASAAGSGGSTTFSAPAPAAPNTSRRSPAPAPLPLLPGVAAVAGAVLLRRRAKGRT